MIPRVWHLVTGGYPPDPGGVADYTALLGRELAAAGREVHVWTGGDAPDSAADPGVTVHRAAGSFGPAGLVRLGGRLDRFPGPRTVLIQYVPHAYGWKAMNLPFALWAADRARRGDDVRVMFHEVLFPWVRRPVRHNSIAAVTRMMAFLLARASSRMYVSIPAWERLLRRLGAGRRPITWTPIPATVPADPPAEAVAARRAEVTGGRPGPVVGHFGTYGPHVAGGLAPVLDRLLDRRPDVRVLLLGAGGDRWRAELVAGRLDWDTRVVAPGALPGPAVSAYLRACNLVIQPYPDGASSRRTTLMAALANGVPVVTTVGPLSEPLWEAGPVAVAPAGDADRLAELALGLLQRPAEAAELGRAGRRLYDDRFAVGRTVEVLLSDSLSSSPPCPRAGC